MKRPFALLLVAFAVTLAGSAEARSVSTTALPDPSFPAPTSISTFGDSITAGYSSPFPYSKLLAIWTGARVVNHGVSGNTTAQMLARVVAATKNVQMVIVMGGTNDCLDQVPLATTVSNLEQIVGDVETAGAEAVLVGPLPRTVTGADLYGCLTSLHDQLRNWAHANGVPFVDPWSAFESAPGSGEMSTTLSSDGTHPNARGTFVLAKMIADALGWSFPND
jgi:lysophospholipase L1-like esterase